MNLHMAEGAIVEGQTSKWEKLLIMEDLIYIFI